MLNSLGLKFFSPALFLVLITFSQACNHKNSPASHKTVYIEFKNNRYSFVRNGFVFKVKGASGFTELEKLYQAGGTTIRTWDTLGLDRVLTKASQYNLAVIVGLPIPDNQNMDEFYNDDSKVILQLNNYRRLINKYKNHPSILCWCVGNELTFPYKPNYNRFYIAFNKLIEMIHETDGNHPVTTTILNFQPKSIFNITYRTKIDFISINIFGAIHKLNEDLNRYKWLWNGPFLITEWGIDGPWADHEKTAWGAYIENTSTKKAEQYLLTYKQYMPINNPRFLGSLVFYWGQKQETTPTWFSLFDEHGARSEVVKTMSLIWASRPDSLPVPKIKFMLLNDKGARDNILISPHDLAHARVYMENPDTLNLTYEWKIQAEDWFKVNNQNNEKPQKNIDGLVMPTHGSSAIFKAPLKQGPYRIYVYIHDRIGNFATSNTPFYVVSGP